MTGPESFAVGCWLCGWESDAVAEVAEAEQLAGSHDDREHYGLATAWVGPIENQPDADQERRTG